MLYFSYFFIKIYVVGTRQKRLQEVLPMSTNNRYFCGQIRKILLFLVGEKHLIWSYEKCHV